MSGISTNSFQPVFKSMPKTQATITPVIGNSDDKKLSKGTKVAIGLGTAALAAVAIAGIYIATKGKVKPNIKPNERILSDGRKFTREILNTEEGKKTILKLLDKDGNTIKTVEKIITKNADKAGRTNVSIKRVITGANKHFCPNTVGDPRKTTEVIDKIYSSTGKKIMETTKVTIPEQFSKLGDTRGFNATILYDEKGKALKQILTKLKNGIKTEKRVNLIGEDGFVKGKAQILKFNSKGTVVK